MKANGIEVLYRPFFFIWKDDLVTFEQEDELNEVLK